MNHCILEVTVQNTPKTRYTQENKIPICEMEVSIPGLRVEDPSSELKVVGWGNIAQQLQTNVREGQKLIIEGRLRINSVPRNDGTKEKKAELTLSRIHPLNSNNQSEPLSDPSLSRSSSEQNSKAKNDELSKSTSQAESAEWNSSPLIPENDEIPF
tara:strand:- start:32 stop:499 length:468 start_codon:yes stop_codon:yes gene_type:complete